jgi:hypothetical protein
MIAGTMMHEGQQQRRQVDLPVFGDRQAARADQGRRQQHPHRGQHQVQGEDTEVEAQQLPCDSTSTSSATPVVRGGGRVPAPP